MGSNYNGNQRNGRPISFSAGPTQLPEEVLMMAQKELLNHNNTGLSIMEMSHRSPEYESIHNDVEKRLRNVLEVPDEGYQVLMVQGGATGQFSGIPLNFIGKNGSSVYLVSGYWSAKAAAECCKYGNVNKVSSWEEVEKTADETLPSYVYFCANETIDGVVNMPSNSYLDKDQRPPLVCDASSGILGVKLPPVSKLGVLIASAQKMLGCAGITVVVVRQDLLNCNVILPQTPSVLNYSLLANANSLLNTPPTFAIYMMGLTLKWIQQNGGAEQSILRVETKANVLYNFIDNSDGFYRCPIEKKKRSNVNIVFRILNGDAALEKNLTETAKNQYGIIEIRGHRSVGGLRVSLYHGIKMEDVYHLLDCLRQFKLQINKTVNFC